jgi:SNF2 family DNA or RNA helicase
MLALIEAHLSNSKIPYLKLTGASKDRGDLVNRFQSGEAPVFLISLKAGGTGLNLTAADTVIHYDPWWNPAAEAQATDRAYRIGQDKPVFVHKLLCQDTVEQRIHQMQQDKAKLAAGLLSDADITDKLSPAMARALLE